MTPGPYRGVLRNLMPDRLLPGAGDDLALAGGIPRNRQPSRRPLLAGELAGLAGRALVYVLSVLGLFALLGLAAPS